MATQTRAVGTGSGWTNSGNIISQNGIYATTSINNGKASSELIASNFGFTIPSDAVINNISVKTRGKAQTGSMQDFSNYIGLVGGSYYTNKVDYYGWSSSDTDHRCSYSPANWGWAGIAPANINNSNFSYKTKMYNYVGSTQTMYVDYIEITIDYSVPTNFQINIGDTWKTVESMQINIGDVWKNVESVQINIGDSWKTIF